jgi:eukaryotic-like serine/threonine-protein kinase
VSRTTGRDRFVPGMRIGNYRIERELGTEETGVVYLGMHTVLPRQAAVKVMHPGIEPGPPAAVPVLREAILLEALSHPGIPRVFECGMLPDQRPWAAFERIDGTTLADLIAGAPLPISDLVVVLRDVGDLLAHVHAHGVVHRRLTAEAIVRTPDRGHSVCVRHWDDARALDTEPRLAMAALDDVHALGVLVFRALAGGEPDPAVTTAERCPEAPAALAALIDQMLAADPASRPPSDEVRDRARWLADTVEPRMADRLRWTLPAGSPEARSSAGRPKP